MASGPSGWQEVVLAIAAKLAAETILHGAYRPGPQGGRKQLLTELQSCYEAAFQAFLQSLPSDESVEYDVLTPFFQDERVLREFSKLAEATPVQPDIPHLRQIFHEHGLMEKGLPSFDLEQAITSFAETLRDEMKNYPLLSHRIIMRTQSEVLAEVRRRLPRTRPTQAPPIPDPASRLDTFLSQSDIQLLRSIQAHVQQQLSHRSHARSVTDPGPSYPLALDSLLSQVLGQPALPLVRLTSAEVLCLRAAIWLRCLGLLAPRFHDATSKVPIDRLPNTPDETVTVPGLSEGHPFTLLIARILLACGRVRLNTQDYNPINVDTMMVRTGLLGALFRLLDGVYLAYQRCPYTVSEIQSKRAGPEEWTYWLANHFALGATVDSDRTRDATLAFCVNYRVPDPAHEEAIVNSFLRSRMKDLIEQPDMLARLGEWLGDGVSVEVRFEVTSDPSIETAPEAILFFARYYPVFPFPDTQTTTLPLLDQVVGSVLDAYRRKDWSAVCSLIREHVSHSISDRARRTNLDVTAFVETVGSQLWGPALQMSLEFVLKFPCEQATQAHCAVYLQTFWWYLDSLFETGASRYYAEVQRRVNQPTDWIIDHPAEKAELIRILLVAKAVEVTGIFVALEQTMSWWGLQPLLSSNCRSDALRLLDSLREPSSRSLEVVSEVATKWSRDPGTRYVVNRLQREVMP